MSSSSSPSPDWRVASSDAAAANAGSASWVEHNCSWLDEVYEKQNLAYYELFQMENSKLVWAFGVLCLLGAVLNLFVLLAVARSSALRNTRTAFIVNLAVSDLVLCSITAPVTLYSNVFLFWPFGDLLCKVVSSLQALNMFVSCLTLVLIAADRVLLTVSPVEWRVAGRAPWLAYLAVWLVAVLTASPYFFAVHSSPVYVEPWIVPDMKPIIELCARQSPEICQEKTDRFVSRSIYIVAVIATQYILPLAALAFAYAQIGSTLTRRVAKCTTVDQARRLTLQHRNRRALLLLASLVVTYAVLWLPINLYNLFSVFDVVPFSQFHYLCCYLIGVTSTSVNPLIYALVNEPFRVALSGLLPGLVPSASSSWCCFRSCLSSSSHPSALRLQVPGAVHSAEHLHHHYHHQHHHRQPPAASVWRHGNNCSDDGNNNNNNDSNMRVAAGPAASNHFQQASGGGSSSMDAGRLVATSQTAASF